MPFQDRFTLPNEAQHSVNPEWFDAKKQSLVYHDDASLRDGLTKAADALRAFHDGQMDAEQAALAITHPISTSPVPALGGYSDGILAVCNVWRIIIAALVEWPPARTPDLFALLEAMAKVPDNLHRGEVIGDDGEKLTWSKFPYFAFTWRESTAADLQPGQIYRQCPDAASLASALRLYLRLKDIEAQLVSKHVLGWNKQMIQFIIRALEKDIDDSDEQVASNEATGYKQVKLDFSIPAIAVMFKYNRNEIYDQVVKDGLRDWTQRQMPDEAREFKDGAERWSFWKNRLADLAQDGADDQIKLAAHAASESM